MTKTKSTKAILANKKRLRELGWFSNEKNLAWSVAKSRIRRKK